CWRSGCYPILVLGDKKIWHATLFRKLLSSRLGFLVERGKINFDRINELGAFAKKSRDFHLVVFPEGTRGDGMQVGTFQPGLFLVAQEAKLPIVPIFIQNMQLVSTKAGKFHPISGLRKVEVHFGAPIEAKDYLSLPRENFIESVRAKIAALAPSPPATHLNRVPPPVSVPNR
ncbi:MAG: lysophospholipid acyltransferase family protein, partial [Verrucomicrobiota bacterium]